MTGYEQSPANSWYAPRGEFGWECRSDHHRRAGWRASPGDPSAEGSVAPRRRGALQPRVQGVGARRLRARRAGHLGAAARRGSPRSTRSRPTSCCRASSTARSASPRRGGFDGTASRSTSCACTSSTIPTRRSSSRFASSIQLERQDFNGRMLTIRRSDLRVLAACSAAASTSSASRLEQLGLRARV